MRARAVSQGPRGARSRSRRDHSPARRGPQALAKVRRRGSVELCGRAGAHALRRDQCLHTRGAETRTAPENRDGAICRDATRSEAVVLLSSKASPALAFFPLTKARQKYDYLGAYNMDL